MNRLLLITLMILYVAMNWHDESTFLVQAKTKHKSKKPSHHTPKPIKKPEIKPKPKKDKKKKKKKHKIDIDIDDDDDYHHNHYNNR